MTPRELTIEMQRIGAEPIWVAVSASHVGIYELPGKQSQAVILQWAEDLGVRDIYANDDIAWCALYINRLLMACQLPVAGQSYDLLRARILAMYGQPLPGDFYGMFGVFTRPQGAHVGIILGQHGDSYYVRGGNQSNAVSHVWMKKQRCIARRWPLAVPLPTVGLSSITGINAPMSVNEA